MRRKGLAVSIIAVSIVIAGLPGQAAVIHVPLDQPTIQAGMDAAGEGDTVLVGAATYTGDGNRGLDFGGTNMVVMSASGAEATIIDCEGADIAFTAWNGEDSTCVIRGFTITNGYRSSNGGGMFISHASVTIEDCVFFSNTAGSNGGAIYYGYTPHQGTISNCVFFGNSAAYRGGGILFSHCDAPYVPPVISNCIFYDNVAGTGGSYGGGGIYCNSARVVIEGCTVVGNAGAPGAGGIEGYSTTPIVRRTIVAFNTSGPGVYNVDTDHCIIFGNAGDASVGISGENLDVDPLFCDKNNWDLMVCSDSPCLPASSVNPWGELIGAYEAGCGDCYTPVKKVNWGSIKSLLKDP